MAHSKWGTSQWKAPHFKPRGSEGKTLPQTGDFQTIMLTPQW